MAFSQFLYLLFLETFCSGNNFYMTKINCVQTKSFRLAGLIWETLLISIVYYWLIQIAASTFPGCGKRPSIGELGGLLIHQFGKIETVIGLVLHCWILQTKCQLMADFLGEKVRQSQPKFWWTSSNWWAFVKRHPPYVPIINRRFLLQPGLLNLISLCAPCPMFILIA